MNSKLTTTTMRLEIDGARIAVLTFDQADLTDANFSRASLLKVTMFEAVVAGAR